MKISRLVRTFLFTFIIVGLIAHVILFFQYKKDNKVIEQDLRNNIVQLSKDLEIKTQILYPKYDIMKKSSVIVKVGNKEDHTNYLGSGVIVKQTEDDLYILTVKHVVERGIYCLVKVLDIDEKLHIIKILDKNKYLSNDHDVALIIAKKPNNVRFISLPISKIQPKITDKVYIIGHPIGIDYTFGEGRVSNYFNNDDNYDWLMVSVPTIFGNSGSPVFNDKYEVIGIVSGSNGIYDKQTRQYIFLLYMTRAVKVEYLRELLEISQQTK